MINLDINDQRIEIKAGSTVIEAADMVGIYIPRFCYHKELSIVANCRMCLVEVVGARKPLPACATQVTEGMKVYTMSEIALKAQRDVMEFLLINHPLDCPVCDQGGECELQDQAMGYGRGKADYDLSKRVQEDEDIGPLIQTFMTRCIHCTRCIRFGDEIAGLPELGMTQRGGSAKVATYVKHTLQSELSGNIIDLCPVGALTSKPFQYRARAWEMQENPSIAPHDCVGSHIFAHTAEKQVLRVVPREAADLNENWLSDRDRFSYLGLQDDARVTQPMIKRSGRWQTVSWERALAEIVDKTRVLIASQGTDALAGLISPNATVEEMYLFQKMLRGLSVEHIDHRIQQQDFSHQTALPIHPSLGCDIADIETLDTVLLVGSFAREEQPMLNHRINKVAQDGGKVLLLNTYDHPFNYPIHAKVNTPFAHLAHALAAVAVGVGVTDKKLAAIKPNEDEQRIADALVAGQSTALLLGPTALSHPDAALLHSLASMIAEKTGATVGSLTVGANTAGAWLTGCVPHRGPKGAALSQIGRDAKAVLTDSPTRAYYLFGTEIEHDAAYSERALKQLNAAAMTVCFSSFKTKEMDEYADFILPIAAFTEISGTFVNVEGRAQTFRAVNARKGEAQSGWKVLRALASLFDLPEFDFTDIDQVRDAYAAIPTTEVSATHLSNDTLLPKKTDTIMRFAPWPMYRVDPLVRRAEALQQVTPIEEAVMVNADMAKRLGVEPGAVVLVSQGERSLKMPLRIDSCVPDYTALLPSGISCVSGFGEAAAPINIRKRVG